MFVYALRLSETGRGEGDPRSRLGLAWFSLDEAREQILKSQALVIDLLVERLKGKVL